MTLPDVGSPKSIWFITTKELGLVGKAKGIRLLIGRAATEPSETECLGDLSPFDTGAWTQHSNEEQLTSTVMRLCNYADVFLFHNFTSRLSKFIERNRLVARPLRRTLIQDFDLTPKLPGPYCNPTVTSEGNDGLSISSERGFNDH